MSLDPVKLPSADSELAQLIDLMCDGAITPDERDRLESLLENDRDAKLFCIAYLDLHAQVLWLTRDEGNADCRMRNDELRKNTSEEWSVESGELSVQHSGFSIQNSSSNPQSPTPDFSVPSSLFIVPHSSTAHYPLSTIHSLLFSYMAAVLILGVGILMAWAWKLPDYSQIARQSVPLPSPPSTLPSFVGRITGMVDCQFEECSGLRSQDSVAVNPKSKIQNPKPLISLGDKFALASGLMEITYDTGAKVILQGPVTYEVDSAAGGFLSVGKLTAKVEKRGERRGEREDASDSALRLPPSALFAVRTPTATVTDLGTEFGVEVDAENVCHVETFTGLVTVSPVVGDPIVSPRSVPAGVSVRVEPSGKISTVHGESTRFARDVRTKQLRLYSKVVLEDRPLAYWPLNESPAASWVVDRSGNNCDGHVFGNVRFMQGGPFPGNHSRSAEFSGNGYIQTDPFTTGDPAKGFSVEIWAKVDGGNGQQLFRSPITYRTDDLSNRMGFALYAMADDRWSFQTGTGVFWAETYGPPVVLGQWLYIVGTFAPTDKDSNGVFVGVKKLYINGELVGTETQPWKPNDTTPLHIGAGISPGPGEFAFIGRIAEVAVYGRPLDENRIKVHWEAGKSSDTAVGLPEKEVPSTK